MALPSLIFKPPLGVDEMKIEIPLCSGGRGSRERLRQQSVTKRPPAVHNANCPRKKENDDEGGDERIDDKQEVASPAPPRCNYQVM